MQTRIIGIPGMLHCWTGGTGHQKPLFIFHRNWINKTMDKETEITCEAGLDILQIYSDMRNNMHIVNVTDHLEKMEKVYRDYVDKVFELQKKGKRNDV